MSNYVLEESFSTYYKCISDIDVSWRSHMLQYNKGHDRKKFQSIQFVGILEDCTLLDYDYDV